MNVSRILLTCHRTQTRILIADYLLYLSAHRQRVNRANGKGKNNPSGYTWITGCLPFTQIIQVHVSFVNIQQLNLTLWEKDLLKSVSK